jgi:uncharacterized protein with FMN-binding domain
MELGISTIGILEKVIWSMHRKTWEGFVLKRIRLSYISLGILTAVMVLSVTGCGPRVFNNGTYSAVSQADDKGYGVAEVTIEKDKITDVKLSEFTGVGMEKDYETYPYQQAKTGRDEMQGKFVGRQDANVDTVAGVTHSSEKWKEAVGFALEKARKTPTVNTTYFDGTFLGKSDQGERGYGIAWVTIQGDKITAVKVDDVSSEGELKDWATYPYPKALEAKTEMENRFVEKGTAEVDAYTGATTSSTNWISAVNDALNKAKVR